MDLLQSLSNTPLAWVLAYAPMIVAVCSLIDSAFPQPRRNSRWRPLRRAISRLACNVRHASNAEPQSRR